MLATIISKFIAHMDSLFYLNCKFRLLFLIFVICVPTTELVHMCLILGQVLNLVLIYKSYQDQSVNVKNVCSGPFGYRFVVW